MFRSTRLSKIVMIFLLGLLIAGPGAGVWAQGASRTFPETGYTVSGLFWTYWQEHGGLEQQGLPISEPFMEKSDLDGNTYLVQYFERAVFEEHPANNPPFNVLLSQLGTARYNAKYPTGAPGQVANNSNGSVLFPETGKRVGGRFLEYWQSHGGLAQQGYPISEEFTEVSELDGKSYTVQYFERAVFELHPENAPPFDVLLSQLGTFQLRQKYPNGTPDGATPPPAQPTPATNLTPAPAPAPLAAELRDLLTRTDAAMNSLTAMKVRSTNVTTNTTNTAGVLTDRVEYSFQAPDRVYSKITSPRSGQIDAVAEETRIGNKRYSKASGGQWTVTNDETAFKWPQYNMVYVAEHGLEATLLPDSTIDGVAVKVVRVAVSLWNSTTVDQYIHYYISAADYRVLREVTTVPVIPSIREASGLYTSDFYDFNVANNIPEPVVGQ